MARTALEVEKDIGKGSVARWSRGTNKGEKHARALLALVKFKKVRKMLVRSLRRHESTNPLSIKKLR